MNTAFKDIARFLESKAFPILFSYVILEQIAVFYANRSGIAGGLEALLHGIFNLSSVSLILFLFIRVLLIAFNILVVVSLARSPQGKLYQVERPLDVIVPLLSTFFVLATNMMAYSRSYTNFRMLPASLNSHLAVAGLLVAICGASISLLGIWHLGDSFAIFIERRRLVRTGPYRFFRHPIYLGHGVRMVGYWLMTSLTHHFGVMIAALALLIYRAHLENERLERVDNAAYKKYRDAAVSYAPRVAAGLFVLAACCLLVPLLVAEPAAYVSMVQVDGPGLPVVFAHGAGGSKEVWSNQLEHLRQRHRAVAIDLLRHEYPEASSENGGAIAGSLGDIEAAVTKLGLTRFVLVGHSMGSDCVIEYANRHPEQVAGLLLVDPSGDYRWLPEEHKEAWLSRFEDPKRRGSIWNALLRKSKASTRQLVLSDLAATPESTFRSIGADLLSYSPSSPFARYPGPKLSLFSSCDKNSGGPDNRFSPLPRKCMNNVSHWMMLDDPSEFNRNLDEFLAKIR
jgi:pimeloyl-ACP methyl ester carboxylesterase/isoprenylcysteine carboxyl methyltransferase (ICMT) family protein YpbQ